jgi:hypothetical protein
MQLITKPQMFSKQELSSQWSNNMTQLYWYGSRISGVVINRLQARVHGSETIPILWVTTNKDYAQMYADYTSPSVLYLGRISPSVNLFNALSQQDWRQLISSRPEFKNECSKFSDNDWIHLVDETVSKLERDELFMLVRDAKYDGVWNFEMLPKIPATGLFNGSKFAILREYVLDSSIGKYVESRGIGTIDTVQPRPASKFTPSVDTKNSS